MTLATHIPLDAVADDLMIYRFTVEQYQHLIDVGILPEDGSYELLHGIVLRKDNGSLDEGSMGHKPSHALVVTLLSLLIAKINSPRCHLRIQLPIVLGDLDAPEPDGSIVRGVPRDYSDRLPNGQDVSCVIEVAGSSLDRDQTEKLSVYAAAGIPQYLLINLQTNLIETYAQPDRQLAKYGSRHSYSKGQTISLNLGGGQTLDINASDLLT